MYPKHHNGYDKSQRRVVSMFIQSQHRPFQITLRCFVCGTPFLDITGELTTVIDNGGPEDEQAEHYDQVYCKRCPMTYRIYH